jgi:hypothetical protein
LLLTSPDLHEDSGQNPTLIAGVYLILRWFALPHAAKMDILESNRSQAQQKQNAVRFQAATTQLDLAIPFYLVASATKDQDRSTRAIANAQKAYAIAASSLDCNLKTEQKVQIEKKLILLNAVRSGFPTTLASSLNEPGPAS